MFIWSRRLCRWIRWHGSHAAWLRLPRAHPLKSACLAAGAAVGAVSAHSIVMRLLHTPLALAPYQTPPTPAVAVPCPSSFALLATGVIGLLLVRSVLR